MLDWLYFLMGSGLIIIGGLFSVFVLGAMGATAKWSTLTWFILISFMCVLITVGVYSVIFSFGADFSF